MKQLIKVVVIIFLFITPVSCMAWGKLGHRIVGAVADTYLTAKAKQAIKQILGNESIAIASNWADFIRSDSSYEYLTPWHYINLPDSLNYLQMKDYLQKDTAADAYTKLNFLIAELKKHDLSKEKKVMYLHLLIHIVGDIHQPMHVSRDEDWGGNKIKVMWFKDATNLHSVWDDKLIEFQELSYTEYTQMINFATPAQVSYWQNEPIEEWFFESHQLALSIYDEIKQLDQKLGYRYNYDHIDTLNNQLLKGGVRLAGILNEIFG